MANATLTSRRAIILLVDDDPGDQELTRRALQDDLVKTELYTVGDGEEALDYMFRRGRYSDPSTSPRPDLIMLDLNMPKMNGREVLKALKQNPEVARIPVVIMTTSQQEADILRSYDLGCNSYVQKPVDMEQFVQAIRRLGTYWFEVVTLPD